MSANPEDGLMDALFDLSHYKWFEIRRYGDSELFYWCEIQNDYGMFVSHGTDVTMTGAIRRCLESVPEWAVKA